MSAAVLPAGGLLHFPDRRPRHRARETYIDAFRGLMAVVMIQGHVFDFLVSNALRAQPGYTFQTILHGSTAPGFLFASGFVAGLPRAPLSMKAAFRRGRRLLFVLALGYAIHLPYLSLWKTAAEATPAQRAALFACDALQVIALTQLVVLVVQAAFRRYWTVVAALLAAAVLVAGPFVWQGGVAAGLPLPVAAYLDLSRAPSQFPIFPFSAFVLAGTVAGAALGRQDPATRRRRALGWGAGLIAGGLLLAVPLSGHVPFWGVSPAYALIRIGALLLLMQAVEAVSHAGLRGLGALALIGHESLLAYVLHLLILYGGVIVGASPLSRHAGTFGFVEAGLVLLGILIVVYAAALLWHRVKAHWPHAATLILVFLGTAFVWELLTRPW